ncbi:MAG: Maf family protein [Clostridia bacterium]|nr:Maf family protein [Clostridia bacterium]
MGSDRLVLASASPRRKELLREIGMEFDVIASHVDEEQIRESDPGDLVMSLAHAKAADVASEVGRGLVVGADTIVVIDGTVLGKPADRYDAARMLRLLAGREHQVYSGVSVVDAASRRSLTEYECTDVRIRPLSEETICRYVETGEPMDKAGAYAIQGIGALIVEGICGDYSCVVGLPLGRLALMLSHFGLSVL